MPSESPLIGRALQLEYPDGATALNGVDIELKPGKVTLLLGPNGSGKSTLLRILAGLQTPTGGRVETAQGKTPTELSSKERARQLAYLPQNMPAVSPFTVGQMVLLGRHIHAGGRWFESQGDRDSCRHALEVMGLLEMADRPFSHLSGGEQQRVHLARILCQEAPVYLLDEPVAGLDPGHQFEVLDLLVDLVKSQNLAALVSVHDPNLAARFADEVVFLSDGQVVDAGPVSECLTAELLEQVFGLAYVIGVHPKDGSKYALASQSPKED